jgi:hypothetical protein
MAVCDQYATTFSREIYDKIYTRIHASATGKFNRREQEGLAVQESKNLNGIQSATTQMPSLTDCR